MKKLIALILAVFMTLTVVGCSANNTETTSDVSNVSSNITDISSYTAESYQIKVVDGQHYLLIPKEKVPQSASGFGSVVGDISFKSVDDFINTVKNGNFTRDQYSTMVNFFKKDENGIKTCNPDKIYEPVGPKEFFVSSAAWSGETYGYSLTNPENCYVTIRLLRKEGFNEIFKEYWVDYNEKHTIVQKTENSAKENYTEIFFSTDAGELKNKRYKLETNVATYETASTKTEIYVREEYFLRCEDPKYTATVSSEIPYQVTMFVQNSDLQYQVMIYDLASPVTPEWLLQFGLKPRS